MHSRIPGRSVFSPCRIPPRRHVGRRCSRSCDSCVRRPGPTGTCWTGTSATGTSRRSRRWSAGTATGVWAACVRLAGRDAEDAFQAVFLILSRKAGTVTGSLPAWLHAVTRRVAANLRRNARRRGEIEAAVRPAGTADRRPQPSRGAGPARRGAVPAARAVPGGADRLLPRRPIARRSGGATGLVGGAGQGPARTRPRDAPDPTRPAGRRTRRAAAGRGDGRAGPRPRRPPLGGRPDPYPRSDPSHVDPEAQAGSRRAGGLCVGIALAGGVVLRAQPGDRAPGRGPAAVRTPRCWRIASAAARRTREEPLQGTVDETARKEIADLRKRVEALEGRQQAPAAERQKVVVTNPLAKDVVVAQQYVGQDPRSPPHQRLAPWRAGISRRSRSRRARR